MTYEYTDHLTEARHAIEAAQRSLEFARQHLVQDHNPDLTRQLSEIWEQFDGITKKIRVRWENHI